MTSSASLSLTWLPLSFADQSSQGADISPKNDRAAKPPCTNIKDVFVSYPRDSEESKFVLKLKRDLESRGYSVWVDTSDIRSGSDWHSAIGEAVQNCRAFVAVLTARYVTSKYCKNELFMASDERKAIFPIILKEVDFGSLEAAGIKLAIASLNWIFFKDVSYKTAFSKLLEGFQFHGVKPSLQQ